MWWRILIGLAAAVIFGGVVCYVVNGIINRKTLKQIMIEEQMKKALTALVDTCENKVRLRDLDSGKEVDVQGKEGISSEIEKGQTIYAA